MKELNKIKEIFRDIPKYEGLYQISNFGKVKSLDRIINSGIKYNSKVLRKGRILKSCTDKYGYLKVLLHKDGVKKNKNIHRLVASSWLNDFSESKQVNHKDGNKLNNYVGNLEMLTNDENIAHGVRHNLFRFGENHPNTKLTKSDVLDIKNRYNLMKESSYSISLKYGVCRQTIMNIISGRTWAKMS